LILDLSIPKNVHADVEELEGVFNSHGLFSQLTDETLENRKIIFQLLKLLSKKSKRV
jgi:glutamyl-tRNA reductase